MANRPPDDSPAARVSAPASRPPASAHPVHDIRQPVSVHSANEQQALVQPYRTLGSMESEHEIAAKCDLGAQDCMQKQDMLSCRHACQL